MFQPVEIVNDLAGLGHFALGATRNHVDDQLGVRRVTHLENKYLKNA